MKTKTGVAVLAAICVGLLIALVAIRKQGDDRQKKAVDTILDLSNQVTVVSGQLDELRQVNLVLTNDLAASRQETVTFSNNAAEISTTLDQTKATLQSAQSQITNLDARVADLEAQNQSLDQHAADLTNAIASLSAQITEMQVKLVSSETNNAFLQSELNRQLAEKAELQRKFNDLVTVRAQVRKLRDDALVARRLEWMREGIDPTKLMKGGEILMQQSAALATNTAPKPKTQQSRGKFQTPPGPNDLNVEVGSDGSVRVIPAMPVMPAATNSPSH